MKKLFFALFSISVLLAWPLARAQAVPITDFSNRMSDQRAGAVSDHELRFVNVDAIDAPGKIIDVEFASGFSLQDITVADFRFSHGPTTGAETVEALTTSGAPGAWNVSVTGNTIHLASPADATTGELAIGEKVILQIGLNAGGTHRITNPVAAGTYAISISGYLAQYEGDGTALVPIVSTSSGGFAIGFTVPEATPPPDPGGCGALCGPPPPPPPAEILTISNVAAAVLGESAARVVWTTSRSAESRLYLVGAGNTETLFASDLTGVSHVAELTGLTPDTVYRFLIRSSASGGATAASESFEFRTSALPALPNVRGFRAVRLGDGRIGLSWTEPELPAGSQVAIIARTDRYPNGLADGRRVFDAVGTETIDSPGRGVIFYTAFVHLGVRSSSGAVADVAAMTDIPPRDPVRPPNPSPIVTRPDPRPIVRPVIVPPPVVATTTAPVLPEPTVTDPTVTDPTVPIPAVPPEPTVPMPVTPPTVPTSPIVVPPTFRATVRWQTQDEKLILAENDERPRVFTNDAVRLVLTTNQELRTGQITVDGSRYALAREGALTYATTFVPSALQGTYDVSFLLVSMVGDASSFSRQVEVVTPARVLERDQDDRPSKGAQVRVLVRNGDIWEPVSNAAPAVAEDGGYEEYLPAGQYRLEISKEGWRTERRDIAFAAASPVEFQVVLERLPAGTVAQALDVLRTPQTEAIASVAAPITVAVTLGTTVAVSAFNLLNYLRFLLTQPLLLLRRRRRDKWGIVYHALTKRPVELAVVRLLDAKTGAVRQTRITDAQGRFAFLAPAGSYRIEVQKPGFVFPTQLLASERIDVDLVDLYHGEAIDTQASVSLTPNIPLDPIEKTETPREIVRGRRWRSAQSALSIVSLVVAFVSVLIQPTWLMAGFAIAQVFAFLLFRRLAIPAKPKNWGIAYDGLTRKPLKHAIVRIFDKKYNKLLETQVTDGDGKYAFFAGKNVYYVTADRSGYDRLVSKDVDLRQEALGVIREPLAMRPAAVPGSVSSPTRT